MKIRGFALLPLAALLFTACASGRSGSAIYRRDIGTATRNDAVNTGMQIIGRYGYEIFESDSVNQVRIITHWKQRRPFADETALGVAAAESRITIVARPRGQTEMGAFYAVNIVIENRLRVGENPDWNESTNTALFRRWADDVTSEYRRLVTNIGVRRY